MHTSEFGIKFIEFNETFQPRSYPDRDGHSIGYGYFLVTDEDKAKYLHATISKKEAEALMQHRVNQVEQAISQYVHVPLSQNEYDALVDFGYNVGAGAMGSSTLVRLLNAGHKAEAADQFDVWIYSAHKPMQALKERRARDKALFLTCVYAGE